jgi:hypothetical protein
MLTLSEFRAFEREVKTWSDYALRAEARRCIEMSEHQGGEESHLSEALRDKLYAVSAELTSRGIYKRSSAFLAFMGYSLNGKMIERI